MDWTALFLFGVVLLNRLDCINTQDGLEEEFVVPEAIFEVFKPRGLRVSIPHVRGITLFALHAKVNEEMNGREGGTISRDITHRKEGYWTFWDPNIKLKQGDVIYYWTFVDYNDGQKTLGYVNDDRTYVVRDLIPIGQLNKPIQKQPNGKPNKQTTTTTTSTTTTAKPSTKKPTQKPGCKQVGITIVNGKPTCAGQLVFEDNFINLDNTRWTPEVKLATNPDFEFCIYLNSLDNVAVKNGNLFLKPTLSTAKFGEDFLNKNINLGRNCTALPGSAACSKTAVSYQILPPTLCGRISTREKFTFKYGKIEIRAKLPKGRWIYPILYLQPKEYDYGADYDSGEMRIAFTPGNDELAKDLTGGVILSSSDDGRSYGMRYSQSEENWANAFHTYVLKWKPEGITVGVDGTEYGSIVPPEGGFASEAENIGSPAGERWKEGSTPMAPFDKEMFITLGVGVGGHSFSDDISGGKPWKNKSPKNMLNFWQAKDKWFPTWSENSAMRIDYVKITAY